MPRKQAQPREVANTEADPTLPKTPVQIGRNTYNLCFDYGALAEAEQELLSQGHNVSILRDLPTLNLATVRALFPVLVRKFHPELGFEAAQKLVNIVTAYPIATAILEAWKAAVRELGAGDDEDPVPAANPPKP